MKITRILFVFLLLFLVIVNSHVVYADDPTPTPGPCTDTAPTDAPNLYQITPASDSATLYFAPPGTTYTGFIISYGLDSNADTYNATMSQGASSGAITYTVNALTPNSKYFFKVQAINNCATGPWSTVLNTTTGSGGSSSTSSGGSSGSSSNTGPQPPVTGSMDAVYLAIAAGLMIFGGLRFYTKFK